MKRKKLEIIKSDTAIKQLTVPEKGNRRYPVQGSPGLYVTVSAGGAKAFTLRYRVKATGIQKLFTIGSAPDWKLPAAKAEAKRLRREIDGGADPKGELDAVRALPTVGELLDAYLASDDFKNKADTTRAVDAGRIKRHLRPLLGHRRVDALELDDIKKTAADIANGKTATVAKTKPRGLARVRGGAGTANEAIKLLRAIFSWAVAKGLTEHHSALHYKIAPAGERETILSGTDDYRRMFDTLDQMESAERIRPAAADSIRLIALTGARRGEVVNLRWAHVELAKARIVIPSSAHKTGKATGKSRVIGLPAVAQAIIARQPKGGPDDLVFESTKRDAALSLSKLWRVVRKEAGLPTDIGLHGLRHSTASHLAMGGASAPEIMAVLGHRQLSTVTRYIKFAEEARNKLAERAAATAIAGMTNGDGKAEVVSIERGRR